MGRASRKKKARDDSDESAEQGTEVPKKKGKSLLCYKCGKKVSEFETSCPHCGAKPPRINPAVLARILLGVIIAIILYIYLM